MKKHFEVTESYKSIICVEAVCVLKKWQYDDNRVGKVKSEKKKL